MKNISIKDTDELLNGFTAVCSAVAETLGAEGKYAILEAADPYSAPVITKDGFSVAKQIFFPEKFNNIGAYLAKQVATKTLQKSGDSTTTSLVLAKAFLKNANKYYNKAVERGLNIGYLEVIKKLNDLSVPVNSTTLKSIATISANNDEKIGQIIIDAYEAVGIDGLIDVVQDFDKSITELCTSKGMVVDSGYASPWLVNNQENATWSNENVLVICVEAYGIDALLDEWMSANKKQPILLIMERFDEVLLAKIEGFVMKGTLDICLVQAPDFDKKRRALMEDTALYTEGNVYIKGTSTNVVHGIADRVIAYENRTEIIKKEVSEDVLNRVEELKSQLKTVKDVEFIRKRIQKLEGLSCTIRVGGVTPSDSKERFDRVEDAVASVKSAKEEGWVAGGGTALAYISGTMQADFTNKDEQRGYNLMRDSIQAPLLQIVKNSNRKQESSPLHRLFFGGKDYLQPALDTYGVGYNAKTDQISNLISDGVIDSTKSIRVALENSKSVVEKLLNVGVIVTYSN
jgi:chaperonin GroEL